ncbi:conserved hypothetical protein [Paraburkholderia tropica]|uniref:hypothetical protein n=1 Tax=Paraburkholderia tropica TaxID=92647 RepID=UPI001CB123FD|nr:hypothetical protein [Paraburkholderia tropica]CAG9236012.1 conserved hypothetical protein [Paraburkholderia tropica]
MILQALGTAMMLTLTLQMVLFLCSPAQSLKAAYADSWRKTGKVGVHLFQLQPGPEQWIGISAFGLVGFYGAIAVALDIAARFAH